MSKLAVYSLEQSCLPPVATCVNSLLPCRSAQVNSLLPCRSAQVNSLLPCRSAQVSLQWLSKCEIGTYDIYNMYN